MSMYENIKAAARKHGMPVSSFLAMSPKNDPFYAGKPSDVAQALWFGEVWRDGGFSSGAHLRRLHYWVVSMGDRSRHNGKPYENTDQCWGYLCQAAKMARYLGIIEISDIADHKNPDPVEHFRCADHNDQLGWTVYPPEIDSPTFGTGPYGTGIVMSALQPYMLEIWCEKSTMNDVLLPLCGQYSANLVTGEGEMSITAVYRCIQRIANAGRPTRIFYVSDFDPAGQSMPVAVARKLEYMLERYDIDQDVRLMSTVLTIDQVEEYNLPRVPIKESEARAGKFEERHGEGAVELDALEALHPGILEETLKSHLERHFDHDVERRGQEVQRELNARVDNAVRLVMDQYTDEIEALQNMVTELEDIEIDTSDIVLPGAPEVDDPESGEWMFSSGREYGEQIAHYHWFKGKP